MVLFRSCFFFVTVIVMATVRVRAASTLHLIIKLLKTLFYAFYAKRARQADAAVCRHDRRAAAWASPTNVRPMQVVLTW